MKRSIAVVAFVSAFFALPFSLQTRANELPGLGQCRLGPLFLGMKWNECREILDSPGFPGLRDSFVETSGRSFLNASGNTLVGLVFNRLSGRIQSLRISRSRTEIEASTDSAGRVGFTDWRTRCVVEDWTVTPGIRLGDTPEQVMSACGEGRLSLPDRLDAIVVRYNRPGRGEATPRIELEEKPGGGNRLVITGKLYVVPHILVVYFENNTVVAVSLLDRPDDPRSGT